MSENEEKQKNISLTQFKKDAKTGQMRLELLEVFGKPKEFSESNISKVIGVKSDSIILDYEGRQSELVIQYESLVEYTGDFLNIYIAGNRDWTEHEKSIFAGRNIMEAYNIQKRYFDTNGCLYLFKNCHPKIWCDFTQNRIYDSKIRGNRILSYRVLKEK